MPTTVPATLTDTSPPSIAIASPLQDSSLGNYAVDVSGTASDNAAIASVRGQRDARVEIIVVDNGSGLSRAERLFVTWAGLKGAVPILLASLAVVGVLWALAGYTLAELVPTSIDT